MSQNFNSLVLITSNVFRYLPYMIMRIFLNGTMEDIGANELNFGKVSQSIAEKLLLYRITYLLYSSQVIATFSHISFPLQREKRTHSRNTFPIFFVHPLKCIYVKISHLIWNCAIRAFKNQEDLSQSCQLFCIMMTKHIFEILYMYISHVSIWS